MLLVGGGELTLANEGGQVAGPGEQSTLRMCMLWSDPPPAVGQLYDPMREQLPEAMTWRLSPQDVELLIAVPGSTSEEVAATRGRLGRARFAFIERSNVLVLCHRLGTGGWTVQPWQAARQDHLGTYAPDLPAGDRCCNDASCACP
ncbi:hypothetical protein [Nonomuraea jiangxiensis]|uniref:Uncharacterized protein n=1 Tax=Nonomuraea jiangxiensis TaxID=633440 RepID=A0A1G8BS44_9ACTN|nr:hypothetical protein [Nonomuraea jiangxiensis]SDH35904.1 hypothetical protein SAMN05421869_102102 [Nonomuraea jiangxiensis]